MQREELELLRSRTSFVAYAIVAVMLVLAAGFWHFQMAQTTYYTELSNNNQFKQILLRAPRGPILDREGREIVSNRASYDVEFVREGSKHTLEETVDAFATGLGTTREELLQRIHKKRAEKKYIPIVLKEDIGVAEIAFVKPRLMDYPEIRVEPKPRRRYQGELAAHAIGYLAEISPDDLKRETFKQYKAGDEVGKSGLERQYNNILRGKDGYRLVVVDSVGRQKEVLRDEPAIPGSPLRTTIDLDLQRAAEEALGDQMGGAVAIDPLTGDILVMVSKPSYDPSKIASMIGAWSVDKTKPMWNRVIQDRWAPGSVFKVFMTVAGLESETLNPYDHVNCNGVEKIYGIDRHCWKQGGHGPISLYDALVNSCNIFFYNVGKKLDIDVIASYAQKMGLGHVTGVDLPFENGGLIPSREWASARKTSNKADRVWRDSDTISVAIGQGAVAVTPIQVTAAMGGLAAGGQWYQPHLVTPEFLQKQGFKAPAIKTSEYHVGAETLNIVTQAMWGVVNDGGTGTAAAVKGFDVAGKTGTAQVVALSRQKKGDEDTEDNAWFVGYAPYRNPEIAVGVFIEHGGHGGVSAAPVAHAIFDTFYKKKTGQFKPATSGQVAQKIPAKP